MQKYLSMHLIKLGVALENVRNQILSACEITFFAISESAVNLSMRRPNTQTKIHMNPISHYLKPCELISHKQLTRRPEHSETGSMIVWQLSASTLKRLITHLQSSNMRWIFLNHRRAARQLWWHLRRRSSSGCGRSSCRSVAHQHCRSGCWSTHPLLCLCLRMVGGGHCRGTGMMVMMMKVVEVVMTGRGP